MNDKAQLKSVTALCHSTCLTPPSLYRIKARFQTRQGSYREKSEKLKKKIEKLDEQLRQAKENPLDTHTWKQKGMASIRLESNLRACFLVLSSLHCFYREIRGKL